MDSMDVMPTPGRRNLIWLPTVAAMILIALCAWRIQTNRTQDYASQVAAAVMMRPAPPFEALDSDNHLVRLNSFLGRHTILLTFIGNPQATPAPTADASRPQVDPEALAESEGMKGLLQLRDRFEQLNAKGIKVIAITSAVPKQTRNLIDRVGKFPFPIVSDFDPLAAEGTLRIHRQWGRLVEPDTLLPGIFLIDRKGQVRSTPSGPQPIESNDAIEQALR